MSRQFKLKRHPLLQSTLCRKSNNVIRKSVNLDDQNWRKVGVVRQLYMYPFLDGAGLFISSCNFNEDVGMTGMSDDLQYRDHMFAAYDCKTNRIIRYSDNFNVRFLSVTRLINDKMQIAFCKTSTIEIELNKIPSNTVRCTTWWPHKYNVVITCFDCGQEAAEWISRCLENTNTRLAYRALQEYDNEKPQWRIYQEQHSSQRDENLYSVPLDQSYYGGSLSPTPDYKLMPISFQRPLGKMLIKAVKDKVVLPYIVITTKQFKEIVRWNWIMFGKTILRNIRPKNRCETMAFDWENMSEYELLHLLPLRCEIFVAGPIKIGDEVFVKL